MMKLGLALVACIAALGCGGGSDGKQCRAEADELTRWLGTLNLEPQIFQIEGMRLVGRSDLDGRRLVAGPTVTIGARDTVYQGQLVGDAGELEERLTATRRKIEDDLARGRSAGDPPSDPRQLHLLVDEAAPWARVVAAVEVAHRAGFTIPSFPFTPPPGPSTRPPRTAFDDRMDALERDLAVGKIPQAPAPSESLLERCPAATRLFGQLGMMETGDKAAALVRGIGPALVDCSCKTDLPGLRSMLWHLLNNSHPVRGLAVEISPDAPPIALPASTPWREASKRLTPATRRAWFAVGS
jgi:hypothetical protein